MKNTNMLLFKAACLGLLLGASTCFAQMYTVTDLGTLGGSSSTASGINASGQVVGWADTGDNTAYHAFRTAPNSPINPATDDLGTLGGSSSRATGINASGQVAGWSCTSDNFYHPFRTAPNTPINPATDDLLSPCEPGPPDFNLCDWGAFASGINDSGQVVGWVITCCGDVRAFRTAPNSPIAAPGDYIGSYDVLAHGINASGQVVGAYNVFTQERAFRVDADYRSNPIVYDLGTLAPNGVDSDDLNAVALDINDFGQVAGTSDIGDHSPLSGTYHAFRTAPNSPINPATDDLGPGSATGIDNYGQVVGGALYSNGQWHDLNPLIAAGSGCTSIAAVKINNAGQIAANGNCDGQAHAVLLSLVYKASVQPPIKVDGSSVFPIHRGVVPVKFRLTQYDAPTCTLLPSTIAVTRIGGGPFGTLDQSTYLSNANDGSNFRIDPTGCQYVYNLAAWSLGVGIYRVDISINGIFVGHAAFALE